MRAHKRTIVMLSVVGVLALSVSPAMAAEVAGAGPLDKLGINLGVIIAQLINFGLILLLLGGLVLRPALNMIEARGAKIQKGLEDAAAAANARRNAEAEAEKILAQARSEANQIVAAAGGRGEEVAKNIETEARAEADKIRADARVSAQTERDAELAGVRGQVVAISVALAERLIGSALDANRQKELVSDFLTKAPAGAKALGGEVTVISAMPLEAAEQDKVKKELTAAASVVFKVDPSILGGLVLRSGDRVIDGSVRSNLNSLASRIN